MAHRQQTAAEDEPLISGTRKLQTSGKDDASLMVNIATEACDIIGFPKGGDAKGTEVSIEIYADKYVIRPIQE